MALAYDPIKKVFIIPENDIDRGHVTATVIYKKKDGTETKGYLDKSCLEAAKSAAIQITAETNTYDKAIIDLINNLKDITQSSVIFEQCKTILNNLKGEDDKTRT